MRKIISEKITGFILLLVLAASGISFSFRGITPSCQKLTEVPLIVVWGAAPSNTFVDARDGHVYRQIKIGGQTWMAENLNYGKLVVNMEQYNNGIAEKTFYNNDSILGKKLGGLYTWNEACNYQKKAGTKFTQGLCPEGWHLPSDEEWQRLTALLDPCTANSVDDWSGCNIAVLLLDSLSGKRTLCVKTAGNAVSSWFFHRNETAYFWTSSAYSNASAMYRALTPSSPKIYRGPGDIMLGMSVRCVKDN